MKENYRDLMRFQSPMKSIKIANQKEREHPDQMSCEYFTAKLPPIEEKLIAIWQMWQAQGM
jgi:hypothetical protein